MYVHILLVYICIWNISCITSDDKKKVGVVSCRCKCTCAGKGVSDKRGRGFLGHLLVGQNLTNFLYCEGRWYKYKI